MALQLVRENPVDSSSSMVKLDVAQLMHCIMLPSTPCKGSTSEAECDEITYVVLYAVAGAELHNLPACVHEGLAVAHIGHSQQVAI